MECCLASQPPSLWSGRKQTHLWAANLDNSWPEWELTAGSSFGIVNADVANFLRHYSTFYASRDDSASWLHDADWWFDIKWWEIDFLTSSLVKIMLVICWNPETFRQVKSTESQDMIGKRNLFSPNMPQVLQRYLVLLLVSLSFKDGGWLSFLFFKGCSHFQRPIIRKNYLEVLPCWVLCDF